MRKLLCSSVVTSLLLAMPVSGAMVAPVSAPIVSEPDFGFVRGMNIEWSEGHMAMLPTDEHDAYHAQIQAELEALFAAYNGDVPLDVLRDWMREKAREHRLWHLTHAPVDGGPVMPVEMVRLRNGDEVQAPPSRRFLRSHVRRVYQQTRTATTVDAVNPLRTVRTFSATGYERPAVERISRRTLIEQYKALVQERAAAKLAE